MITVNLPFKYKITFEKELPKIPDDELMSIKIGQQGACVKLAVPAININPRALLLAVVHQETYIKDFVRISTMSDVETGLWNSRALKYQSEGDPMAYTRALYEIVEMKSMLTIESNKDVS